MPPKEVWIGGITQRVDTDTSALPPPPAHSNPSPMAIGALRQVAVDMAPWLAGATQLSQGCCLYGSTPDGLPVLGAVQRCLGAYLATGHGRHGVLTAPSGGRALAELILLGGPGKSGIDLNPFTPLRF